MGVRIGVCVCVCVVKRDAWSKPNMFAALGRSGFFRCGVVDGGGWGWGGGG